MLHSTRRCAKRSRVRLRLPGGQRVGELGRGLTPSDESRNGSLVGKSALVRSDQALDDGAVLPGFVVSLSGLLDRGRRPRQGWLVGPIREHHPDLNEAERPVRVVECRDASWDAPRSGVHDRWRRTTRAGHILEDGQESGLFRFDRRADARSSTIRAMVASSVAGWHGRTTVTRCSLRRAPPDLGLLIIS
jgi:hypothetical protein